MQYYIIRAHNPRTDGVLRTLIVPIHWANSKLLQRLATLHPEAEITFKTINNRNRSLYTDGVD